VPISAARSAGPVTPGCRRFVFAAAVLSVLLGGCAADPFLGANAESFARAVELTDTPFYPQEAYQCGPAALATVLAHSGVRVSAEDLVPAVWLPERRGSLQPEMMAASRVYMRHVLGWQGNEHDPFVKHMIVFEVGDQGRRDAAR
jgi:hypothetical protein